MDKTTRRQFLKGGTAAVAGTVLGIPLPVNAKTVTATDFSMEKKVAVLCRMCAQKCPAVATVLDGRVVRLEPNMGTPYGAVCGRAAGAMGSLYDADRISTPLIRDGERGEGKFRKATWSEALDVVASKMKELKEQGDEKSLAYLPRFSSAGGMDKGFFHLFGTPNIVGYGDPCFGASLPIGFGAVMGGTKLNAVSGPGTGAVSADYENAKYGVLIQRNVGGALVCHPWGKTFGAGKINGMQVVVVDPRKPSEVGESGTEWAAIKPGTDGAFLLGLMNEIFTKKYYDEKVIRSKTNAEMLINIETGLPVLTQDIVKMKKGKEKHITDYYVATSTGFGFKSETASDVQLFGEYNVVVDGVSVACKTAFQLMKDSCAENTAAWAAKETTLPESQIQEIASKLNDAKPACFIERGYRSERYASSLREKLLITQVNALLGAYGAKGGIISNGKVGFGKTIKAPKVTEPSVSKWLQKNDSKKPFIHVGHYRRSWIESIFTEKPYKSRVGFFWGQNIVGGSVGAYEISEALKKLEMVICVSPYWNETTMYADVILPDATFLERDECLNGKWKSPLATLGVNLKAVEPLGESKDGYWIVNELARRIFPAEVYEEHFGEYDREGIMSIWKKQYAGIKGITEEEKATLPSLQEIVNGRVWAGEKHYKIKVKTKTGKMEIYPTVLAAEYTKLKAAGNPDAEFANPLPVYNKPFFLSEKPNLDNDEFVPITGFHPLGTFTGQQTKNNLLLKSILDENKADHVFINNKKGMALGLKNGDSIKIFNTKIVDRVSIAKVILSETVQEDTLFAYYGVTAGFYDDFAKKLSHHDGGGFNPNHLSEFLFSPLTAGNPAQDFTVKIRKA
jgi:anaerobic selenocysteine-containing dehydrogenase